MEDQQAVRAAHGVLAGALRVGHQAEDGPPFVDETRERIANLTIRVDRLVERDLGRSNGGI